MKKKTWNRLFAYQQAIDALDQDLDQAWAENHSLRVNNKFLTKELDLAIIKAVQIERPEEITIRQDLPLLCDAVVVIESVTDSVKQYQLVWPKNAAWVPITEALLTELIGQLNEAFNDLAHMTFLYDGANQ